MDPPESQNAQDARVERLWRRLDTLSKGELDLQDLRRGLKKIDHRQQPIFTSAVDTDIYAVALKDAEDLLQDVMKAVDTNGDGKIQYEEFRTFVEHTEKELLSLFNSIDRDHNGNLDKGELQAAFQRAGLLIPPWKLDQFFEEVDSNHDGVISFEEWRNFLLFLPAETPELKAVLSYYSSTVKLNAEGDIVLRDETVQSLGSFPMFLNTLFGSIIRLATPPKRRHVPDDNPGQFVDGLRKTRLPILNAPNQVSPVNNTQQNHQISDFEMVSKETTPSDPVMDSGMLNADISRAIEMKSWLTVLIIDPGYFAAGGIAGAVSRTATAPLDRLKVYLIANTGSAKDSLEAVKQGEPLKAVKHVGRPLIDACKELWRAGGIRSLFAGNGLNVIKVMPESAIKFGSYEAAKRALAHLEGHGNPQEINPYSQFVAGGLGGMFSQLCVYPIDTLKFRMQSNVVASGLQGNALIISTAKQMYTTGGFRSAYRGLTMGLVGMFPYSAIDLGTFEFLKTRVTAYKAKTLNIPLDHADAYPGSFATGAIGAFSGAFGASIVYPINLLRTRLQVQGTVLHPQTYDGVYDAFRKTISKEGVRGLFKGITPNLLKVVPAVSITYVVYENAKKALNLR